MRSLKELLRDHLLASTMLNRWETLTDIKRAIHNEVGMRFHRHEIWKCMLGFSRDGIHTLDFRRRDGTDFKEYRLYVKPEAVGISAPNRKFFQEYLAKQDYLERQGKKARRAKRKA